MSNSIIEKEGALMGFTIDEINRIKLFANNEIRTTWETQGWDKIGVPVPRVSNAQILSVLSAERIVQEARG